MGISAYSSGVDFSIDGNLSEVVAVLNEAGFRGDTVSDIFEREGFVCEESNDYFEVLEFMSSNFDNDRVYNLLKTVSPFVPDDKIIEMSSDGEYWRYAFSDGHMTIENGEISYNADLIKPNSEVYIVSIKETDEYLGGMIGAGLSLEEAKGLVKASSDFSGKPFEYEIVKVNPGLVELDNETYRVFVHGGIVETELAPDENVFERV